MILLLAILCLDACCSMQRPCYVFVLFDFLDYAFVISNCVWSKLGNSPFPP